MSAQAKLDLSQFREAPEQMEQGKLDLAQFREQPEQEKGIVDYINQGVNKAARLGTQAAIGAIQRVTAPLDIPIIGMKAIRKHSPLDKSKAKKLSLGLETPKDEKTGIKGMDWYKNTNKWMNENDFDEGSLIEHGAKSVGVDLAPRDASEMALRWYGFIKNPKKSAELIKSGFGKKSVKDLLKSVMPTGKEAAHSVGAAVGLEAAAQNEWGPLGTILSAIIGHNVANVPKAVKAIPDLAKKGTAKLLALPSKINKSAEQRALQKELIQSFRSSGLQADVGTITGSKLVQALQTALDQSQFTGDALETFKQNLLKDITKQYTEIAETLGSSEIANRFELGEALKNATKVEEVYLGAFNKPKGYRPRNLEGRIDVQAEPQLGISQHRLLHEISPVPFANDAAAGHELRNVAQRIERPIRAELGNRYQALNAQVGAMRVTPQAKLANNLSNIAEEIGGSYLENATGAEAKFLREARTLLNEITVEGDVQQLRGTSLERLLKTKKSLGDIPNWEIRGSRIEEQFKRLYGEVNEAIEDTLRANNPQAHQEYINLNREYTQFKDTFEARGARPLFRKRNVKVRQVFTNGLNNADNLDVYERILSLTQEGKATLARLKRDYAQKQMRGGAMSERETANLRQSLGDEHGDAMTQYEANQARINAREGKGAIPQTREVIGINVARPFDHYMPKPIAQGRATVSQLSEAKALFEKLKDASPEKAAAQMSTVSGIKQARRVLSQTSGGRELYNQLARYKLDEIFGANLRIGVENQLKTGTFTKVLNSKANRDIARELLSPSAFAKIMKLEKNTAQLSQTAQRFFNASKSGTRLIDMTAVVKIMHSLGHIFAGNPWPIARDAATLVLARKLTNMIADPKFLALVADTIMSAKQNESAMSRSAKQLLDYAERNGVTLRAAAVNAERDDK